MMLLALSAMLGLGAPLILILMLMRELETMLSFMPWPAREL
jgi:hypothetical protein